MNQEAKKKNGYYFFTTFIKEIIDEAENLIKCHFKDDKKIMINYNQNLQLSDYSDLSAVKKLNFIAYAGFSIKISLNL